MTLDEVHKNMLEPSQPSTLPFQSLRRPWRQRCSCLTTEPMPIVVCCVNRPAYINFTKRVQIASVMKKILEQQSADYALQPIDCIQVLHNCYRCSSAVVEERPLTPLCANMIRSGSWPSLTNSAPHRRTPCSVCHSSPSPVRVNRPTQSPVSSTASALTRV